MRSQGRIGRSMPIRTGRFAVALKSHAAAAENRTTIVEFLGPVIAICACLSVTADTGIMAERSGSIDIRDLQDTRTPFGVHLSGIYKRSFAYVTIKDRLPVILTKVIDTLSRGKDELAEKYGQDATEDIKRVVGFISKLKNEMVTNKALRPLTVLPDRTDDDAVEWNKYLEKRTEIEGGTPTWFNTVWLYCECYMYRSLRQEFALTKTLQDYDPFEKQKQSAFTGSLTSITALSSYILNITRRTDLTLMEKKEGLIKLLKLNLWGNKCDLSLSAGAEVSQSTNPIEVLQSLDKEILVDNSEYVWQILQKNNTGVVDVILDNAGYELFTDLCLATFLVGQNLARKVRFYVKRYPWYVSDTTRRDFNWTLEYMNNSTSPELKELAKLSYENLENNVWSIEEEPYWTLPYEFAEMREKDPTLYAKLSDGTLTIIKGDLNYRKLLGDINFEYTTAFTKALRGFRPTNVLSLRTVKADVCVGLKPGLAEKLFEIDENWMFTGQYGLVQATINDGCQC